MSRSSPLLKTVFVLLVFFLIILAYGDILDDFFTGSDTLTLIETSRLQSFRELLRLLVGPLMQGSSFSKNIRYYRPITSLSFSLDYAVWQLEPLGYHATDLFLHFLVAVALYALTIRITENPHYVAFGSVLIFAIHPVLIESVPASARRQDILASLFVLLTLRFYITYDRKRRADAKYLGFALLAFAFGLGAKETAIVTPVLVMAYNLGDLLNQQDERAGHFDKMSEVGLFLAVALVYFVGRLAILGGLGGKSEKGLSVRQIAINYVADFFRPVILRSVKLTHITIIGVASGILISVAIVLYMNWVARSKRPSQSESLLGSRRIMDRKGVWLLLSWLFSLLGVFAFTRTFNHYNMYMPVIPFSVLFSVLLSESLRLALRGITVSDSVSISYIHYIGTAANCLLMIVLVNLLITSPVLNSYREWEISGDIAEMVLPQIVSVVEGAGEVKYLDIQNVPLDIASYPYRLSVTYLDKRVFESWIKLMTGKYVTVSVDRVIYRAVPRDITVEPIRNYQGKYEVSLFPVW